MHNNIGSVGEVNEYEIFYDNASEAVTSHTHTRNHSFFERFAARNIFESIH